MSPRATAAGVLTAFRSVNPSHVSLVEIATGDSVTPFIRRTDWDSDITFGSLLFTSLPESWGQVAVEPQTQQGGTDIRIADVDGAIAALMLAGHTFRSTRVRMWLTDISATGGAGSDGYLSYYYVQSVVVEDGVATFHTRPSFAFFDLDLPRGTVTRTDFPGLPSDGL